MFSGLSREENKALRSNDNEAGLSEVPVRARTSKNIAFKSYEIFFFNVATFTFRICFILFAEGCT